MHSEVEVCEGLSPINGRNERRDDIRNLHTGSMVLCGGSILHYLCGSGMRKDASYWIH